MVTAAAAEAEVGAGREGGKGNGKGKGTLVDGGWCENKGRKEEAGRVEAAEVDEGGGYEDKEGREEDGRVEATEVEEGDSTSSGSEGDDDSEHDSEGTTTTSAGSASFNGGKGRGGGGKVQYANKYDKLDLSVSEASSWVRVFVGLTLVAFFLVEKIAKCVVLYNEVDLHAGSVWYYLTKALRNVQVLTYRLGVSPLFFARTRAELRFGFQTYFRQIRFNTDAKPKNVANLHSNMYRVAGPLERP